LTYTYPPTTTVLPLAATAVIPPGSPVFVSWARSLQAPGGREDAALCALAATAHKDNRTRERRERNVAELERMGNSPERFAAVLT
jgi:hypothetical protein